MEQTHKLGLAWKKIRLNGLKFGTVVSNWKQDIKVENFK